MKSLNIDNSYSLDNIDNYYKELEEDISEVINKYVNLLKEYSNFVENNIKIRNKIYIKFIVKRGLETITNVFLNILYYTKNLNLTYFHCQKSFYFYVEFIGQITDDQNTYLQLSSRDASIYVYRKTIFEINNEFKKNFKNPSKEISEKFDLINLYIDIYKLIQIKMINSLIKFDKINNEYVNDKTNNEYVNDKINDNKDTIISNINSTDYLIKINSKIKNNSLNLNELNNINDLVNILANKIDDENTFINIILLYFKKINKNTSLILKLINKIKSENFDTQLNDNLNNNDKFVNWLIL